MDYYEARDSALDHENIFHNSFVRTQVHPNTPMYQFYKGINIFMTGASGFMGKVFIEKILRCYPEVGGIYMLLRPKKNKSAQERLVEQFQDELFDRVKMEQPGILSKLHIISGDLNAPMLGISQEDQTFIEDNVDVILHAAASLRFDELIVDAFRLNIQATEDILILGTRCTKLKAFVHVSTLYTHSYLDEIDEIFYPNQISPEELSQLIASVDQETVETLSPLLFGNLYNNTYAFTKALGESVVQKYMHKLPLAMVRPSIVISTWKEPIMGWSNNLYGPGGAAAGAGLGVLHTFYAHHDKKCDLIPVDTATNMIVAIIWKTAQNHLEKLNKNPIPQSVPSQCPAIYNLSTSSQHPITWFMYMFLNADIGKSGNERYIASTKAFWHYSFSLEQSKVMFYLRVWFLQMIPGFIVDYLLKCLNKEPQLMKIYIKIMKFSKYFYPYVEKDWLFHTSNVQSVLRQIPREDMETVDYSLDKFTWRDYLFFYFRGGRLYVLRDRVDIEEGWAHFKRLRLLHFGFLTVCYSIFAFLVYKIFGSFLQK